MLYWKANFQIPNSGAQASEVYAIAQEEGRVLVTFYSDRELSNMLFEQTFPYTDPSKNIYEYLLEQEYFEHYEMI